MNIKKTLFFSIKSIEDKSLPPSWYGGSKGFEATVLIGSYNYIKIADLINFMKTLEWEYMEDVQLLYKEEGDDVFKLINLL